MEYSFLCTKFNYLKSVIFSGITMKKASIQLKFHNKELSPVQEIKVIFSNLGPALRRLRWCPIIVNMVGTFFVASIILSIYRLLDGAWILINAASKAAFVAGLIGFNYILQDSMPYIRERFMYECAKLKKVKTRPSLLSGEFLLSGGEALKMRLDIASIVLRYRPSHQHSALRCGAQGT